MTTKEAIDQLKSITLEEDCSDKAYIAHIYSTIEGIVKEYSKTNKDVPSELLSSFDNFFFEGDMFPYMQEVLRPQVKNDNEFLTCGSYVLGNIMPEEGVYYLDTTPVDVKERQFYTVTLQHLIDLKNQCIKVLEELN